MMDKAIMTEPVAEVAAESSQASHKTEYSDRMRERQTSATQLQRKHLWLGNVRIAVFVAILIQCWITGKTGSPSIYWLLVPIAVFIALVIAHRRVVGALNF